MALTAMDDDPVARIVDRAMEAQTRLLTAYLENMRESMRAEIKRELHEEFAGERAYFGKGTAARNVARDEAIRLDAKPVAEGGRGMSLRALSRKHHLSKTRIAEVLAAVAKAE